MILSKGIQSLKAMLFLRFFEGWVQFTNKPALQQQCQGEFFFALSRQREKERKKSRERSRGRERSRDKSRVRNRSRDKSRGRERSREKSRGARDRSRGRDKSRGRERSREKSRGRNRSRSRERRDRNDAWESLSSNTLESLSVFDFAA